MVQKFVKKPVVVEALQWTINIDEMMIFLESMDFKKEHYDSSFEDSRLRMQSINGIVYAKIGDWVIKEPFPTRDKQFYPCEASSFEKSYKEVKSKG